MGDIARYRQDDEAAEFRFRHDGWTPKRQHEFLSKLREQTRARRVQMGRAVVDLRLSPCVPGRPVRGVLGCGARAGAASAGAGGVRAGGGGLGGAEDRLPGEGGGNGGAIRIRCCGC
ncbi:hypothetical protein AB5I41_00555 [Sphingomonas sp. MMS24-JH45]